MVGLTDGGDPLVCAPEHCDHDDLSNQQVLSEPNSVVGEQRAWARSSVAQVKDSMLGAFDNIVQSGTADQMRGYANEAMGKTKLTLGIATQSTQLTLAGLAQIVVGEFQKSVGEAKLAEDAQDMFPGI